MNKSIATLLCICLVFSCKSPEEKLKIKVMPILKSYVLDKQGKNTYVSKIDSLRILRIDTITPMKDSNYILSQITDILNIGTAKIKTNNELLENQLTQLKLYGELGWNTLFETTKGEIKKIQNETSLNLEKLSSIKDRIGIIDSLNILGKIDTVSLTGYNILFKLIGQDNTNNEVRIDTGYLQLSKEMHIRENPKVEFEWEDL